MNIEHIVLHSNFTFNLTSIFVPHTFFFCFHSTIHYKQNLKSKIKITGCVSSSFLNSHDDDFPQIGSTGLGHHIVSLTSTTYGFLILDPPSNDRITSTTTLPPTPPSRFALGPNFRCPVLAPRSLKSEPEIINSWELMTGLDTDSFRFLPLPLVPSSSKPLFSKSKLGFDKENVTPNRVDHVSDDLWGLNDGFEKECKVKCLLEKFEESCPPNGENKIVVYTTTLRGVRKTYEACNAIRAAIEGLGVVMCERDVSMDRGFRDELKELMKGKGRDVMVLPQVFLKGRYVGGAEELLRIHEEGCLGELLYGLPKRKAGVVCEGCGGVRFLPCFSCNGSCKMVMMVKDQVFAREGRTVVLRCPDCNENGLVLCPICS